VAVKAEMRKGGSENTDWTNRLSRGWLA
jgi:hypothetical protein